MGTQNRSRLIYRFPCSQEISIAHEGDRLDKIAAQRESGVGLDYVPNTDWELPIP